MLDKFFSRIGFDPLKFVQMQPRDQRQTLMDLLGIDFSEFETERAKLLQDKSNAVTQMKSLDSQLDTSPRVPENTPDEEISSGDLIQQIQNATAQTAKKEQMIHAILLNNKTIEEKRERIESLQRQLQELYDIQEDLEKKVTSINPEPLEPLHEQLKNIEETNRQVRQKQQVISISERLLQVERIIESLNENIKSIDQDKRDALESAKFPVKGLTFDESGVLFQGVPLKQASSAEQIRVSLAIGIAMNPSLKFLIIRDGSLLDSRSRELIANMAAKHNMQVFIEAVDESGYMGFVIDDGMVRAPVETIAPVEPGQQVLA